MTVTQSRSVLSDDLLERCAQRAAVYDRENRFFFEDFDELREAGYLLSAVPKEFGGLGLTLARNLPGAAPVGATLGADSARHQYASPGDRHRGRSMAQRRQITGLDA